MSIIVTPDSPAIGAMCTAHLQYGGAIPPLPNDVHIDAKHDDGSWHAVIGYDTIPPGINPAAGFDIRFSSGSPTVGGPGDRTFRVRWTLDGALLGHAEETRVLLGPLPPVAPTGEGRDILDYIVEAIKWVFLPLTGVICLLCLLVGDRDGSCGWACGFLPGPFKKH